MSCSFNYSKLESRMFPYRSLCCLGFVHLIKVNLKILFLSV